MNRLVYILAASHSGSTLLAMLLGAHPDVCTVGELKLSNMGDIERYRCGCGEPIKLCRFWQDVYYSMRQKGFEFDLNSAGTNIFKSDNLMIKRLLKPLHRGPFLEAIRDAALALHPEWHKHRKMTEKNNSALVSTICEISGAKIVVDSSKVGLRLKYLLKDPELDIRVLRLIRDGRGVTLTYVDPLSFADAKDPSRRAGGFGGNRDNECLSVADAANEWKRCNEEAEAVLATMDSSKYMEVRYDKLCSDPKTTLENICRFLEIDPLKVVLDFRSKKQHVVGNGMRLDATSEITCDERWREHLTREQLEQFNRVAGKMNRKYGYA